LKWSDWIYAFILTTTSPDTSSAAEPLARANGFGSQLLPPTFADKFKPMNPDVTPQYTETSIQRRKALALLGLGGLTVASNSTAIAQQTAAKEASSNVEIRTYSHVAAMRDDSQLQEGWIACTLG